MRAAARTMSGRADRDEAQPEFTMTKNDTVSEVARAVERLGYDLSAEDLSKVYEEFSHTAEKKNITSRELDAIVASVAMPVPADVCALLIRYEQRKRYQGKRDRGA